MTFELDASALKADFPILQQKTPSGDALAYLDNAASTQRPNAVIDALSQVYQTSYANIHRGIHWLSEQSTENYEDAREAVRRFINAADSREIVFTSGTTAGVNLAACSWGDAFLQAGDEIVLTEMEHHSNIVPWQQLAQRVGCRVRFAPLTEQGLLDLEGLEKLLSERVKLVAFTAVSNVLGVINPVEQVVQKARRVGAVTLVDAAQAVPHQPLDVRRWNADFVVFSGHKMLGPSGIGILYGRRELLEKTPPFLGGGGMIHHVDWEGFSPAQLPAKFEAGTPPIAEAVGLAAAIEYLQKVGLEAILQHEKRLTEQTHAMLREIDGVRILGPPTAEPKCGVVSFVVEGVQANDLAMMLDEQGVAVRAGHHCAMPLHQRLGVPASLRASFYLYNTPQDVEQLGEAMRKALKILKR